MHETSTNPSQTILDHDVRRVHELTEELRTDDSFWGGGLLAGGAPHKWSHTRTWAAAAQIGVDGFLNSKVRTPSQRVGR